MHTCIINNNILRSSETQEQHTSLGDSMILNMLTSTVIHWRETLMRLLEILLLI